MGRYVVLDTMAIADVAIDVDATTLDDLFQTAAAALSAVSADPDTVRVTDDRAVRLEAPSIDLLLFDWLSELIFLKDREQLIVRHATVHVAFEAPLWRLTARLDGGRIGAQPMALRADVKAVTLHELAVERVANGWRARFVLDI